MAPRPTIQTIFLHHQETADQLYTLQNDGAAYDLTGKTPGVTIADKRGQDVAPTIAVNSAAGGRITMTPAGLFTTQGSPYRGHVTVTSGADVAHWPNRGAVLQWVIY